MSKPLDTIMMNVLHWGIIDKDIRKWFLHNMLISTNRNTVYIHIPLTWSIRARKVMIDKFGKQCTTMSNMISHHQLANELHGFRNVHMVKEPDKELISKWDTMMT